MKNARKYLAISLIIISLSFILFNSKKEYLSEDNVLGIYVNNELSDNYPSKDSAMFQKAVCDDSSTKVTWDNDNWGLLISNLNKKVKCNLYFYSGETVFNFDYTGGEQTFTASVSGTYRLETWGAQGGGDGTESSGIGGQGGYSTGNVYLSKNKTIYINNGGQGARPNKKEGGNGGYNGGGNGGTTDSNHIIDGGYGGGGATHISMNSGLLLTLENYKSDVLIISGGGGGAMSWNYYNGGAAGGYIGELGSYSPKTSAYPSATQTSGYSFGKGMDGAIKHGANTGAEGNGGGGGGYYGGLGKDIGNFSNTGGGGGSGYIGNPLLTNKAMYCYNCEESSEESTKTISTTCSEETPTSNCAKKGNGYARITLVSIDE